MRLRCGFCSILQLNYMIFFWFCNVWSVFAFRSFHSTHLQSISNTIHCLIEFLYFRIALKYIWLMSFFLWSEKPNCVSVFQLFSLALSLTFSFSHGDLYAFCSAHNLTLLIHRIELCCIFCRFFLEENRSYCILRHPNNSTWLFRFV